MANATVDTEMQTQLRANNSLYNLRGRLMTGPLRISLWAVPPNGQVGKHGVVGHLIARSAARMEGGQGPNGDQMWQVSLAHLDLRVKGRNPAAGDYCIVMTAEEEATSGAPPCLTQDRYCVTGWHAFDTAVRFE